MKPEFKPGKNIAIKTPEHEYAAVVEFYRDVLGFEQLAGSDSDPMESVCFKYGDKSLWVDKIPTISQSEIWLEIEASDIQAAQDYLQEKGCSIRNEIERLPAAVKGFWLSSPANIIHLVTPKEDA